MATFVSLIGFTDQGIRAVKQSPDRAQAFKATAQRAGVTVKDIYWTLGEYDAVIILEAPDDETATAALLSLGALGNVRSQTLRAFSAEEMGRILARMP